MQCNTQIVNHNSSIHFYLELVAHIRHGIHCLEIPQCWYTYGWADLFEVQGLHSPKDFSQEQVDIHCYPVEDHFGISDEDLLKIVHKGLAGCDLLVAFGEDLQEIVYKEFLGIPDGDFSEASDRDFLGIVQKALLETAGHMGIANHDNLTTSSEDHWENAHIDHLEIADKDLLLKILAEYVMETVCKPFLVIPGKDLL